jgi:hypothetical protein
MIHYFFTKENIDENRRFFDGLAITKSPVFEQHQGQYPGVSLSFKSCKGQSFDLIYAEIVRIISNAYKHHEHILEKDIFKPGEIDKFQRICDEDPDQTLITPSLLLLSEFLHRYYQKKVFITWFGFTQEEVDLLLNDFRMGNLSNQVKNWYNGYYFGNEEIYNPWTILCFADSKGDFKPYWLSTNTNALVHKLIRDSDNTVKKVIEDLLNNRPVCTPVNENISFEDLESNDHTIMSFLIQTGYLKVLFHGLVDNRMAYKFSIPNEELRLIYIDTINKWFNESIGSKDLDNMLKALISGDIELFEDILNVFVINYLSFYQTLKDHIEKVYHAFVLGMLITLKDSCYIESERESGYGRVDILMTPKEKSKPGIVIEMKKIRPRETTETALEAALQQIEDRRYEAALRQHGCTNIMKVAVTFDGKRAWAKRG